ncbi:acetoacetate decarboxylase family protein [Limibacillus halophilus]|uniref:Acetoacetate decarboxylase n=1 Tax=Limibacillus halophilus TaxID=1579333 RepID=A0A839STN3_9PROT|nr:acetoacetate decarboxylase family protein [Limibacillus halophilus]MBB3066151.1 acetoacetate decarboxylase [Limibacillus halophilus]
MQRPFSTPHIAPLYAELPYHYRNVRKISVFCQCDPAALTRFLPDEFELVGDTCEVFVMDAPDAGPLGSYTEAGLVIPARYDSIVGAHVALEYVSSDDSLAAGREIWGYPKKIAEVTLGRDGTTGKVVRRGATLIDVTFTPSDVAFEKPVMHPRLQIKTFAAADGSGFDYYQVIRNDLGDIKLKETIPGSATLTLGGNDDDPLPKIGVKAIVGAEITVVDFLLGNGSIVADLNN